MVKESNAERAALGALPVERSAPVSFVAGDDGTALVRQVVSQITPLPVDSESTGRVGFSSGVVGFTPVATATDILALQPTTYGRTVQVEAVTISGTCTSGGATLDVLFQRSANGGGGTSAAVTTGYGDKSSSAPHSALYSYTANRTSGGTGIDSTRTLHGAIKLNLGAAGSASQPVTFRFQGGNKPVLHDLIEWFVVNLNGQTIPAGTSLDITVEWSERALPPVIFAGDSTTSNATTLFTALGLGGNLSRICNFKNRGSNGATLENYLLNTSGVTYPMTQGTGCNAQLCGGAYMPAVLVLSYGLNDMRQGAKTKAELISMIDAAIYATLNGTTGGATYTSPHGAGTTFTWAAGSAGNSTGNPDAKIILWSPNTLCTDGNGSSFVVLAGRFASGYTVAEAAQVISDDLFDAYDYFKNDPRVFRVVHKRDIFGPTSTTMALSGSHAYAQGITKTTDALMTDIAHPNARGQILEAQQIVPVLVDALVSATGKLF